MKTVSIIIPCRNEERYIGGCLDSLLANGYPKDALEIVVVDGMSTDRTREIVRDYCHKYTFIKMIDNPWHIKPKALNIGVKATKSDVVMRIDVHAFYAKDYISKLMHGLFHHNADNIGGVRETYSGETPMAQAIAVGISHPFSVGDAYWRTGTKGLRKVDTVFCGCYRRDVFDRIGLFNEQLIRTQDKEFNARLVQSSGSIILDPAIKCTYFPRTTLNAYVKWIAEGAFWLFYARRFTDVNMTSLRNFIPLIFLLYHIFLFIFLTFGSPIMTLFAALPLLLYWGGVLYFASSISWQEKSVSLLPILVLIFPATHFSYAFGSVFGMFKAVILGEDNADISDR